MSPPLPKNYSKNSNSRSYQKFRNLRTHPLTEDHGKTYKMFSAQLYALGHINAYKNKHLRRAIIFFGTAILSELLIVMSMAWGRALQFLFPA